MPNKCCKRHFYQSKHSWNRRFGATILILLCQSALCPESWKGRNQEKCVLDNEPHLALL
jgi:hypothetical protein